MGDRMKIHIRDININYEVSGVGPPLIFLHGWGSNLHVFDKLVSQINEDYTIYQIDLPGFGESEILDAYTIEEYAEIINMFCLNLGITKPIFIGHSFGGRIAIKYASLYSVEKLILISSPGVKERFDLIKWLKIKMYKISKKLNINLKTGSTDYKNATGFLKDVLVKAVNNDLTFSLLNIKCETLIIHGKEDRTVPLYIAVKNKKMIPNAGIVIVKKAGHFPFVDRFRLVIIVIKSFLSGNKF